MYIYEIFNLRILPAELKPRKHIVKAAIMYAGCILILVSSEKIYLSY